MKKLFATLAENTQKELSAAMKRPNLETHHILTTKTTASQKMNDKKRTAHFTTLTKPSETLLDELAGIGAPDPNSIVKPYH
jgi:hypothetical protein